jgi:hypothetical protein
MARNRKSAIENQKLETGKSKLEIREPDFSPLDKAGRPATLRLNSSTVQQDNSHGTGGGQK